MALKIQLRPSSLQLSIIVLSLSLISTLGCSRQQTTQHTLRPNYALPKDSLSRQITIDTAYLVSVHTTVPPLVVRLVERTDTTTDQLERCSYQILVTHERDSVILQSISHGIIDDFGMMPKESYPGITFVDANFDGYLDIQMFEGVSVNGQNTAYLFYLYNPKLARFELAPDFSDNFGCNTIIDTHNKEITCGGGMGCAGRCYEIEKYRFINNQFTLVERNKMVQNDSTLKFIETKEILKGGKLVVVESDTTD